MKFSIVLSTQPASFSALAYKGEIEENIAKIAGFGYDGVELAVRNPQQLDKDILNTFLKQNGLPVPAIGTGQAFGEEGLSFTDPDEKVRRQAIERIKEQVQLAAELNAIVIIGLIRGQTIPAERRQDAEEQFIFALRECAAVNPAVRLAIEPINRYETELLNTVSDSLRFLDRVGMENIGLLLDTFHMNIEEPSIEQSMIDAEDRMFHFHVADSNRWHPGAGHIDFPSILKTLDKVAYTGFISGEMLPLPDPDTSARKMMEYFKTII